MQSLYHQRTTCLHSHARLIITTYNYNRNNNSTIPYLKYIGFTCKYSAHIPPKSLHIVHGASRVAQISRNPSPSVRLVTRDINIYPRAHSFSLSFFTLSLPSRAFPRSRYFQVSFAYFSRRCCLPSRLRNNSSRVYFHDTREQLLASARGRERG